MEYGYATTCDLDDPHYRIQSKKIKVYLDDKVVAHHIFLFAGKIPVLYFPYYVQPLNDRKTHITVIPGESKEWGYYALTSYRYYLDDKNKGDLLLDYRSKNGLAYGVNHYYTIPNAGSGAFKFYFTRENNNFVYEKTGPEENRYRYQVRHDWEMEQDSDTRVTLEFNKLSDASVIKDYFYNEYQELGTDPDNYVSILTQKSWYSAEFLIRPRIDKFQTVVERLPEYKFDIPNQRLFKDYPIYYKMNSSASYLNNAIAKTISPHPADVNVGRIDTYNQVAYAARIFKALNLTPYAGVEETYYTTNKWGDKNVVRGIFKTGIDASIKFYKIYNVTTNVMGLDINNLRHVITPTASYYYSYPPTVSPDNLKQFDSIDAQTAKNGVLLGLENRLQTKRMEGGQMKSVDLATLLITTDWTLTPGKDNTLFRKNRFSNVDFLLELVPYSWMYLVGKMSVNPNRPYTNVVETGSLDFVLTRGEAGNLSAGYRWENVPTGLVNLFTMDGTYKINDKWKVRAYESFNMQKGAFEEQEYTVSRDLHCWIAEFTYNYRKNGDQSLWFILKLKAFPDYPVGLKRTYTRPRFGSNALMQ
jgi:hypothetical protein